MIFRSGALALVEPTYEGVLRACFPNNQYADMTCKGKVLGGHTHNVYKVFCLFGFSYSVVGLIIIKGQ